MKTTNNSTDKVTKSVQSVQNTLFSAILLAAVSFFSVLAFAACGNDSNASDGNEITVITREDGSGTRGAFIELFEVQDKDKVDHTIDAATVVTSTNAVLTKVAGDADAIGYISLGSLNSTVKALQIDGAAATQENVKNGAYKISRPFNIITSADISDEAQDFYNFTLSTDGQKVVAADGFIALDDAKAFDSLHPTGTITVSGSSSVSPLMEKLIEAYAKINPDLKIELNTSDSTTGINDIIQSRSDIGMASRELKDSEIANGAKSVKIATDGLAVIVNNDNATSSLTSDQVKQISTGEISTWSLD